jgi:hypothetical protein
MAPGMILLVVLVVLLVAVLPTWPYASRWGYYPSAGVSLLLALLIVLMLVGSV